MTYDEGLIVGFDPSLTSSGISTNENTKLIMTVPGPAHVNARIDTMRRVDEIIDALVIDCPAYSHIYIEAPMLNTGMSDKNGKSRPVGHLFEMGWLWGRLYALQQATAWKIFEVTPSVLKKFASGKGNLPKAKMPLACYKKWGVEFDADPGLDMLHAYALRQYGIAVERGEYEHQEVRRRGQGGKTRVSSTGAHRSAEE